MAAKDPVFDLYVDDGHADQTNATGNTGNNTIATAAATIDAAEIDALRASDFFVP